jgi:hypothetical protein
LYCYRQINAARCVKLQPHLFYEETLNDTKHQLPTVAGETADFERGSIFFIGTATVILRYAGFTILTDPIFSTRATTFTLATA